MTATADVVIVGGGIMGASVAYHLARHHVRNVVVLEAGEMPGLGSTGLNAGGVRHQFSTRVNIELSKLSISMMARFDVEMDQEVSLRRCGYLFLLDDPADLDRFRDNVVLQNSLGVRSEILDVDAVRSLVPEVNLEGLLGASWCADDGLVDPHGLLQGYIGGARRLGVRFELGQRAGSLRREGQRWSVSTPSMTIACEAVLVAAGAWSREVGALAGVDIPVVPIRRQIAVARPTSRVRADFPFVIDFSRSLYFHREGESMLTGMSNHTEPPGFSTSVDEAWRDVHLAHAIERMPSLGDAELVAEWAGLYEVTPDDQPVIGAVPGCDGLYVCAGFSGHGLMHAPAAGLVVAEEMVGGRARTIDIDSLRPDRFAAGIPVGEYNVV
jgi:sarcosine oxidase subunit beta